MATPSERLPENAAGDLFVDRTCIDCDLCRQIAPEVFARLDLKEQSYVARQPEGQSQRLRALMALVTCPTASIGTASRADVREAVAAYPEALSEDVYFCGFASESSFGAASYLVRRPDGNVLVDSPRAARPLMRRLRALGGVRIMFLTHRDDVADHDLFAREFGCERVIHRADVSAATASVERQLDGTGPTALAPDLLAIPVPGHTRGSQALLFRDEVLFTGDHLWWSEVRGRLHASRGVAWHSFSEQIRSVRRLLDHRFSWVLPGHGWRYRAPSADAMRQELVELLETLEPREA